MKLMMDHSKMIRTVRSVSEEFFSEIVLSNIPLVEISLCV